jgi:diguanylate cyclase (GGDEF)-like protein
MSGKVGAVFSFLAPRRDWEQVRRQIPVLRKYLDEAAPVLASLSLLSLSKEQALRDPLTRCHNRRFLDEFITKYEPLTDRENRKAGLLMADLDFFKQVNDEHGHEAGDAVLQQAVELMQDNIRRTDLLIRYGGEEFLALLQNVEADSAVVVAEKIRAAVDQHSFTLPSGARLHKTISVGVAEFPQDATTMYKAIKFADVALYEAKRSGRNKVVRFLPEMWTEENY